MKKILLSAILFVFACFAAQADSRVGIKISSANMAATGTSTTDAGGTVNHDDDADFAIPAFFIEKDIEAGNFTIALGLDVIPFSTEVDKLDGGDGFDATISVGNLLTAYVQPTFNTGGPLSFFVKAGIADASLEITDISRQATNAAANSDTASTDGEQDKGLNGSMYGAGVQYDTDSGFIRLEGTVTDFDEIKHTNSNSKTLKADSELTLISLSFGKTF
ncbi:outer membrane protein [Candidatus Pelagibacter sp.]|uniref:outer membrane protein n=1 Tax=Candidatus Pelagibacter sp. TaxID=2024849 RepID=UPI003F8337A4|tara:strand:- start:527 stop:1183 length:657 start_codon:yes stop_codon:yes gene_type:complete